MARADDRLMANERLMDWLRDAHDMEEQAETFLQFLAAHIDFPKLKDELSRYCDQTRSQARRVRACIERRGGDSALLASLTSRAAAGGTGGAPSSFAEEQAIKAILASFVFNHIKQMEIAAYAMLIAAADDVGDNETSEVCSAILAEEQAMASLVGKRLPAMLA